jgi:xanthine dehydrogenase small subunit
VTCGAKVALERKEPSPMPLSQHTPPAASDSLSFVLNGEITAVRQIAPTKMVLNFLREDLGKTGTKEGCAEGDCGACTVVIGELHGDRLAMKAVNACLQFVPTLDGKALFTVENLRQPDGTLHPVQAAMVACHGSQCGFCTPGFVMSLWGLYLEYTRQGSRPTPAQIRTALTGNLCRCTGYRPILAAGEQMFDLPTVAFDSEALCETLKSLRRSESLVYAHEGQRFYAPQSLAELTRLRAANPHATILAGGTDVGVWVTKQFRALGDIVYIGQVAELQEIRDEAGVLHIGAGVSLTDSYAALVKHYPQLTDMWERFASVPIRNAGTLGGNVANGSPIGDTMPGLIALGAHVVLRNSEGARVLPMEDLYVAYMQKTMQPDEMVEAIEVPWPSPAVQFRTYKVSKRYDSDISAVCAAFAIKVDGGTIVQARVAFGGMAAMPQRASHTEAALAGKPWTETTLRAARAALATDYTPITDMRAAAAYRMQVAQNLLERFYLETRPDHPLPAARVSVFATG